jgi:hypothetical protein
VPCDACYRFPVPTSNFKEVATSLMRHGTLYKCLSCGTLIEMIEEARSIKFPTSDDVAKYYPEYKSDRA